MIKRIVTISNPAYLSMKNEQLILRRGDGEDSLTDSIPIEDLGVLLVDHPQVTMTAALLAGLLEKNVAVVTCNTTHHPTGLFLSLDGGVIQSERFREQIESSAPLKKQLWAQTVSAKILNQAALLEKLGIPSENMQRWAKTVTSGDPKNLEGRAAVFYWQNIFKWKFDGFIRERFGLPPNNILNYGYSLVRAAVARALVSTGLLPTLGIHHKNRYNAYCLADDIMEPYRPFVDELVCKIMQEGDNIVELTPALKKKLLILLTIDVKFEDKTSPLMIGLQRTTSSLADCYGGEKRKILYPIL